MVIGLVFLGLGIVMLLYSIMSYNRACTSLAHLREEDLVSYYLDLAVKLLPMPFWSAVFSVLFIILALIIILINIPVVF